LAGEGARVVVDDLDLDAAQRVVAELPVRPASAHLALAIDITSTAAVEAAVERAVHHLGGLDVVVNVAPADVAAAVAFPCLS
jgi:meso-butanediol dehydrogenase / (S,S)-butanediol dehydrogenase / diacetyl reductase